MCFTFPISIGSLTCFLNINAFELCFLAQCRSTITCINNNYFPIALNIFHRQVQGRKHF